MGVAVTGTAGSLGRRIAEALASAGTAVAEIPDGAFASRHDADVALADAASACGGLDAVVHAHVPDAAWAPRALTSLTTDEWEDACEAVLLATLWCLQAAHGHLRQRGGRIVVTVPTAGLAGADAYVAASAAGEGQRALLKSAARQWGEVGITLNCLAYSLAVGHGLVGTTLPALSASDPGAIAAFLCSDAARECTGQTIVVDGGAWMPA